MNVSVMIPRATSNATSAAGDATRGWAGAAWSMRFAVMGGEAGELVGDQPTGCTQNVSGGRTRYGRRATLSPGDECRRKGGEALSSGCEVSHFSLAGV